MKSLYTCGIDIGSHTTRVVISDERELSNGKPVIRGFAAVPSRGVHRGFIANPSDAAHALKGALAYAEKMAGSKVKSTKLAIGGVGITSELVTGTSVVTRADAIITKFDVEKAITDAESRLELKNKTILHAFPMSFVVDGKELLGRPEGVEGLKIEVRTLFITCTSQQVDDFVSVVNECGLKVTEVYATPIAGEKLLLSELQKNLGCLLLDIGAETVSAAVYENNVLTSVHVFGIGSLDITKDIALGLRISPEDAENVKLGVVSFQQVSKKKLDEIIDARLSDIFELVDKYLKKIGRSGLLPAGAIISGGGAEHTMTETVAKNMLRIPVRIASTEMQSSEGVLTHTRFVNAYAISIRDNESTSSTKGKGVHDTPGETIGGFLKNLFKQLMP